MQHTAKAISLLAFITTYVSAQTCSQYGSASDSTCLCPPGFNPSSGSTDCTLPVCGGSLYQPGPASPGGTGGFGNVTLDSTCGCSSGWGGPGCTVCNSASACTNSLTRFLNSSNSLSTGLNNTMTCSNIPTAFASSEMSCNVVTPLLQSLFPLRSTLTITRTLNASFSPGGSNALTSSRLVGGDGVVYAQLWYEGVEQFYCRAGSCTQTVASSGGSSVNGSTWVCPDLACTCRPNTDFCGRTPATNLTGAINVLQGPLTIDCSGTDIGTCGFNSPFLQNLFGASGIRLSSCQFGECVQQYVVDQALGITTASGSNDSGLSGGVIAGLAVVGVLLLAVIVMIIWSFITQRKARRNMITDGTLPESGGVGIKWTGVTYEVKTARHTWTRVVAWAKGSGGVSNATSTEGGDHLGAAGGKIVLRDSCGSIPVGGFCCILGPSGAGKSTLVDVLAGKRKAGRVEGNVAFNKADGHGNIKIGYVDQSDILAPTSTVLETLVFAAKLRLPESVPVHLKEERALEVIRQLNLEHVANTRVGSSEHRGISGGEMRRVSIGVELVAAPDVLVLDEPTSGLDSVSASRLIKLLKDLTQGDSRTTIVASIHQPSSALYHAFDQVLLLSAGRQLYFGPGGTAPVEYFDKQGRPCPTGYNIADHLLEIASAPTDGLPTGSNAMGTPSQATSTSDRSSRSSDVIEAHTKSDLERHHTADQSDTPFAEKGIGSTSYPPQTLLKDESTNGNGFTARSTQSGSQATGGSKWWPSSNCSTTFLTQLEVLSGREWRNLKRDKTLLVAHIFFACLLGVFAGGLYYKVSLTIAGFQNRVGSMFFLGTLIAFSSLSALHNLNEVRGLFLRERAGSVYSPQAWLLSRVLFDVVPLRLIPTILVGIIVYFMVGLAREADRFFKFLLILVEYSLGMTLYNFFLAALVRNGGVAILLSSLWNLFLMTYAGFFVNIGNIPPVLRWLRYFSTLGYALEAMSVNEVGSGLQIIDTLGGVPIEINAAIIMDTLFGFDLGNYYRDVLVLFAFIAGFAILLVGTVVYVLRERR